MKIKIFFFPMINFYFFFFASTSYAECIPKKCQNLTLLGGNGSFHSKEVFTACYIKVIKCLKKMEGKQDIKVMQREFQVITQPFKQHYDRALNNLEAIDFNASTMTRVQKRLKLCLDLKENIFQQTDLLLAPSKTTPETAYGHELKRLNEDLKTKVAFLLENRKKKIALVQKKGTKD